MMSKEEIKEKVIQILAKQLRMKTKEIDDDKSLKYDLGIDSVDMMAIVLKIETTFNIIVDITRAAELENVADVVKYIEDLQSETR